MTICLPIYGITIEIADTEAPVRCGTIVSDLREETADAPDAYDAQIDGIERLILAMACAGIALDTPAMLTAIETAVEGAAATV